MGSIERRGPSSLKRIERRAATLRDDPDFTQHLDNRRRHWNKEFPAFAVTGVGAMPARVMVCNGVLIPPVLYSALERVECGDRREKVAARGGLSTWAFLTLAVSQGFWPPQDFPHTLGDRYHPAMPFVALCLMYDPRMIDGTMAWPYRLRPHRLSYDPAHPETESGIAPKLASGHSAFMALHEAAEQGRGMTHHEIVEALSVANNANWRVHIETRDDDDPDAGFFFLPIIPGLRHQDIEQAIPGIIERSNRMSNGEDFVHQRIRECLAAGQNKSQVAKRLGVSRGTVRNAANGL